MAIHTLFTWIAGLNKYNGDHASQRCAMLTIPMMKRRSLCGEPPMTRREGSIHRQSESERGTRAEKIKAKESEAGKARQRRRNWWSTRPRPLLYRPGTPLQS
ncbi:hypothetical protein BDA96_01G521600 [Sorghum bicolor]|uniref:Uncharacterized protein n=2 Tax=Sorghum bicolor TaxID=4558 RepID=A0A921S725_SORBI|nr:hypothetical protein BDA96_01G521600 [Sorghum bicolor]OQU93150.1 hypothetical protein SORBI_3001G489225 [Sorghum bicolor]